MVRPLTIMASSPNQLDGVRLEDDVLELALVGDDADGPQQMMSRRSLPCRWTPVGP